MDKYIYRFTLIYIYYFVTYTAFHFSFKCYMFTWTFFEQKPNA